MAKGRDGLYRRENGILAFRYKDENKKWRERYTGTTDRKEARSIREQFLRELKEGTLPTEMADWRLDQARQWWLEFRKCRVSPGTLTAEQYRLKPLIRVLGNMRLWQVTSLEIDRYVTK